MTLSFENVYRVSARNSVPTGADVDLLARDLGMELPLGYREYVTTFGPGTLCCYLVVKMPRAIWKPNSDDEKLNRELLAYLAECVIQEEDQSGLTPADIEQATLFAYASAEQPTWFATRTHGPKLFEFVEGVAFEIDNGFYGLVERCTAGHHEFPFFEPRNGRRRMRQLYIRSGVGGDGFVQGLAKRWGRESLRRSSLAQDPLWPTYCVGAIEGYLELHLDPGYSRGIPLDSFFVRARYDIDSEAEFAEFVEPLLLPGGGPHEFTGNAEW